MLGECANVQMCKCENVRMCKCANGCLFLLSLWYVRMYKCTDALFMRHNIQNASVGFVHGISTNAY